MLSLVIVEDNELLLECLTCKVNWNEHGFILRGTAMDGETGLAAIDACKPDLIITDIRMSGMNGLEMLKKAQSASAFRTRMVILTGYNQFKYAQQAIQLHVDAFLLKPLDYEELYNTLDYLASDILHDHAQLRQLERFSQLEIDSQENEKQLNHLQTKDAVFRLLTTENKQEALAEYAKLDVSAFKYLMVVFRESTVLSVNMADVINSRQLRSLCLEAIRLIINDNVVCVFYFKEGVELDSAKNMLCFFIEHSLITKHLFCGYNNSFYFGGIEFPEAYENACSHVLCSGKSEFSIWTKKAMALLASDCVLTLQEIAGKLGINVSYLSVLIKRDVGLSFREISINVRIVAAKGLLANPKNKINDIASAVGYQDYVSFFKAFKKETGSSPNQYRNRCINCMGLHERNVPPDED